VIGLAQHRDGGTLGADQPVGLVIGEIGVPPLGQQEALDLVNDVAARVVDVEVLVIFRRDDTAALVMDGRVSIFEMEPAGPVIGMESQAAELVLNEGALAERIVPIKFEMALTT
jgi:hypothetical protein